MDEKKIHSIIDEAMAARDRSVSIYISPDGGISVSVFPWPDEETLRNMRANGKISYNDYAILALPDGSIVSGKIDSWKDYDDGDQIQVKIDGTTYLVHSANIALIKE